MVTAAILALSALSTKEPLELMVVMTPPAAASGTMVEASLVVKNKSTKPVAITRAIWDGGLCGTAGIEVFRDGEKLTVTGGESSCPTMQVMVDNQVTKHRFILLRPGSSTNVYWVTFNKGISSNEPRPSGKDGYVAWLNTATPLDQGRYEVKAFYEFRKPTEDNRFSSEPYEFTPSAAELFNQAFVGKLQANGMFTITK